MINIYLGDCMDGMKDKPDNFWDLAIVDPPYGIGESNKDIGRNGYGAYIKRNAYESKQWDKSAPSANYFDLLHRKSKNQIIFGANHFIDNMPFNVNSSCWIVWDKITGNSDFADCELAWTSFDSAVRKFTFRWAGMLQGNMKNKEHRIHPTQKPVALYKWLLKNYAKEGDKILDTHGGSMSIAIACADMGFNLDIWELDKDYFDAAVKRLKNHVNQLNAFREVPDINIYR